MNENNMREVSIGNWMLSIFLASIPVLGFIMLLIWAFGDNTVKPKSNWAKASLLLTLIGTVLTAGFLFWSFVIGAALGFTGLGDFIQNL